MSTKDKTDNIVSSCVNCGRGEEESDKLKACTACKLVKYCNRECQIAHRPQHKKECRKRAAELHDEKLFKQPPPKEDCPICLLLIPTFRTGGKYMSCCGKTICTGCAVAPVYDNQGNRVDNEKCPFCRTPWPTSDEEDVRRYKIRVEANDAEAMYNMGCYYRKGIFGLPQDRAKALEFWHQAAELGHATAYNNIGSAYYNNGEGVEVDKKKAGHYYELAAMKGNIIARHNLGLNEIRAGNIDRALKHLMIAVDAGFADSLEKIQQLYSIGSATKDDYTKALQSYQAYLGEIKSRQRDEAAACDNEQYRYY